MHITDNGSNYCARDVLRQMLDKANEELVIKKGRLFVTLLKLRISSGEGGDFSSPFKSIGIWYGTCNKIL